MSIVQSLWVSKLRYGLQLCTKVTLKEEERRSASMKSLQLTQNRLLRAINNTKVKDKISIKSMLSKFGLLSVNQLAAQIKLTEVWKSIHVENYAITLAPYNEYQILPDITLRPRLNSVQWLFKTKGSSSQFQCGRCQALESSSRSDHQCKDPFRSQIYYFKTCEVIACLKNYRIFIVIDVKT